MRTARVLLPQSSVLSALMILARAEAFSFGATESSRSRNTRSALLAAALTIIFSLLPGVDSSERRKRIAFILLRKYQWRGYRRVSPVPLRNNPGSAGPRWCVLLI